jgi:hypothetical protein
MVYVQLLLGKWELITGRRITFLTLQSTVIALLIQEQAAHTLVRAEYGYPKGSSNTTS